MNPIDVIALVILAICVIFGLYRGFIQSVLNLGGGLLALLGSFLLYPHAADLISKNVDVTRLISSFTDSQSILGDLDMSSQAVSGIGPETVNQIVEKANLPTPIDTILTHNLQSQVFKPLGGLVSNVGDYVNQTIVSVSINVLCFLLCFVLCFLAVTILINLVKNVFRFPVLKQLDSLAGGVFGLLRGLLLCLIVFTLIPLVQTMVPLDIITELLDGSLLAPIFMNGSLITAIMNERI